MYVVVCTLFLMLKIEFGSGCEWGIMPGIYIYVWISLPSAKSATCTPGSKFIELQYTHPGCFMYCEKYEADEKRQSAVSFCKSGFLAALTRCLYFSLTYIRTHIPTYIYIYIYTRGAPTTVIERTAIGRRHQTHLSLVHSTDLYMSA